MPRILSLESYRPSVGPEVRDAGKALSFKGLIGAHTRNRRLLWILGEIDRHLQDFAASLGLAAARLLIGQKFADHS